MSGTPDLMPLTEWEAQMERLRVAIKNMNTLTGRGANQ